MDRIRHDIQDEEKRKTDNFLGPKARYNIAQVAALAEAWVKGIIKYIEP